MKAPKSFLHIHSMNKKNPTIMILSNKALTTENFFAVAKQKNLSR